MKKCSECGSEMKELESKTPEGVTYTYFKCSKCGEEIVDMKQLHEVAQQYRELKKYNAKVSKWGMSLGIRIPKDLVKKYHLKDNSEVTLISEDETIKILIA